MKFKKRKRLADEGSSALAPSSRVINADLRQQRGQQQQAQPIQRRHLYHFSNPDHRRIGGSGLVRIIR